MKTSITRGVSCFLAKSAQEKGYSFARICAFVHIEEAMPLLPQILSVLSEPTRFEAMLLLWDGQEHCVCELMALLDKGQSCMSRHMAILKKAGLVIDRRDAQWVRYRKNPDMPQPIATLIETILDLGKASRKKSA